jgi:hypothetical protein
LISEDLGERESWFSALSPAMNVSFKVDAIADLQNCLGCRSDLICQRRYIFLPTNILYYILHGRQSEHLQLE